jgi:uncharacterized protein (DUF2062 family)
LFIGCLPLYGLHVWLCLALCVPLGLDTVVAFFASNISNPLVAPLLVAVEVEVGSYLLHRRAAPFDLASARELGFAGFFSEALVGGVVVGALLAVLGGGLAVLFATRLRGNSPASYPRSAPPPSGEAP